MGNVVQSDISGVKLFLNELDKGHARQQEALRVAKEESRHQLNRNIKLAQMGLKVTQDQNGEQIIGKMSQDENIVMQGMVETREAIAKQDAELQHALNLAATVNNAELFQAQRGLIKEKADFALDLKAKELKTTRGIGREEDVKDIRAKAPIVREEGAKDLEAKHKQMIENEKESLERLAPAQRKARIKELRVMAKEKLKLAVDIAKSEDSKKLEKLQNDKIVRDFHLRAELEYDNWVKKLAFETKFSNEQKRIMADKVADGMLQLQLMVNDMDNGGKTTISDLQTSAMIFEIAAGADVGTTAMSKLVEAKVGGEAIGMERELGVRALAVDQISQDLDIKLVQGTGDSDDISDELRHFRKKSMKENFEQFYKASGMSRIKALKSYKSKIISIANKIESNERKQTVTDDDVMDETRKLKAFVKALK